MSQNAACLHQGITSSIHVMGFCTATVEFQDRKINSIFKIFNGSTLYIVTPVIKMFGVVAEIIKQFQQVFIFFMRKVNKFSAAAEISRIR